MGSALIALTFVGLSPPLSANPSADPLADASTGSSAELGSADKRSVTLLVTAGLAGKLADDEHTVANLAATIQQLEATNRAQGRDVAVIDAGVTLVPYAESRYDGGAALATVLEAAGHLAIAPHPVDYSVGPARVAQIAAEHGFQVLRGFETDDERLSPIEAVASFSLAGAPFELRAFAHPDYVGALAAAGIEAQPSDPASALGTADPEALQIAVLHSRGDGSGIVSRGMTWGLIEDPVGYDLLIDPDLEADLALRREAHDGGSVFLVGRELSTSNPWRIAELDLELVRSEGRWRLDGVRQTLHGIDPDLAADPRLEWAIAEAFREFRQAYQRRLPAEAPVDREGLEHFTLQALREAAGTEIAILNQGALRPVDARHFDETPLPRETVMRLLSYDQGVVVGSLKGSEIASLVAESVTRLDDDGSPRQSSLRFAGVEFSVDNPGTSEAKASSILINGHPLYPDDLYSVAVNSWLADGGDGYKELAALEGQMLRRGASASEPKPMEIREHIVLPRLDEAARPLDDPASRGLWRFGIQRFTLSFDGIEVDADESYGAISDSRASTDASRAILADLFLFADQQWSRLRWENRLRVRFGLLDPRDGDTEQELQDEFRLDISAVFLDRSVLGGNPYLGYLLDSEVRAEVGGDGERLPRQFEQSLTAGLEWNSALLPRVRFGVLARDQDDAERAERFGLLLDLNLKQAARGAWPGIEVDLLAEVVEDSAATVERFDLEVSFPITIRKYLVLAPTWNYYRYRDSRLPGAAEYRRFSLALSWSWIDKFQR